ncbi:M16 family metallopeptidase [Chloroherpeton thalassium]|uniref:M16 family metallopeptidase n=1 Tax=Chloroherpeton thalassium TaxID=100716 RepID=UPI00145EB928|nr:insulinase family protein [Chloroherpeton thalassium]
MNLTDSVAQDCSLDEPLPVDKNVTIGKLENGLTYIIRKNTRPENRADLRLVVNAGSVLENEQEQGLAHFVEHMSFNGTTHYEKQELVNFLESVGVRFGADLNAYTGFDETVYMLQIPTDSAGLLTTGLDILKEWAHEVSFDGEEIEKERGVIIEEWRSGRGADTRIRDKQFPVIFHNSQYAKRLPIGQKAILDTFQHATLRNFYKKWYRSDMMAVIAVGDFEPKKVESEIREIFSKIPARANVIRRPSYPVPDHKETLIAIATDPEASSSQVAIYHKKAIEEEKTLRDYRKTIVQSLAENMLNQRLDELAKRPTPPYIFGYGYYGSLVRTKDVFALSASVGDTGIAFGLQSLLLEAKRIREFGFSASELLREKKSLLKNIETLYKERDKSESEGFVREYTRHFLTNEPIPGLENEYEYYKQFVPEISLDEVNRLIKEWLKPENRVILVSAPEKESVEIPTEADIRALLRKAETMKVDAYVDNASEEPLLSEADLPEAGKVVSEAKNETLGTVEWILSNGVRVVLKPTDFKNDEILMSAYSKGGTSLVPDSSYIAAVTASSIVRLSGLGQFDAVQLEKKLSGKRVSINPYISELEEGIGGFSTPDDLETLFKLCYLNFTAPRTDTSAFRSYITRFRGLLENRSRQPETAFFDTLQVTLAQHHFRQRVWTSQMFREFSLEKSIQIYKERFRNAGDFTFFFVGNFSPDSLKPLVLKYLGALPASDEKETWRDNGIRLPKKSLHKIVQKGIEKKSRVAMIFTGDFQWSRENRYNIRSLADALEIRLREVLREEKGGTYWIRVSASPEHFPKDAFTFEISFGCNPERVAELLASAKAEIKKVQAEGLDSIYVGKVKESQRRSYETSLKENSFWLSSLEFYDFHGEDENEILKYLSLVESLSAAKIQAAAKKHIDFDRCVEVVLEPESQPED